MNTLASRAVEWPAVHRIIVQFRDALRGGVAVLRAGQVSHRNPNDELEGASDLEVLAWVARQRGGHVTPRDRLYSRLYR